MKKIIILISLITVMFLVAGCASTGQAVATKSGKNVLSEWNYAKLEGGKVVFVEEGIKDCTTIDVNGKVGKHDQWGATVCGYVSGSGENHWKYCGREQSNLRWVYFNSKGELVGRYAGCVTVDENGKEGVYDPWIPTTCTYLANSGQRYWDYCAEAKPKSATCQDTDDGDVYNKGSAADSGYMTSSGTPVKGKEYEDYCEGDVQFEAICDKHPKYGNVVNYLSTKCSYGCKDGACVKKEVEVKPEAKLCQDKGISGDAWKVWNTGNSLELSNNNVTPYIITGENIHEIKSFIGKDELAALADGVYENVGKKYKYKQFLFFDQPPVEQGDFSRIVKYEEDDDDNTDIHFFVKSSGQIARYKLEFEKGAEAEVWNEKEQPDPKGNFLDFTYTSITMMGVEHDIVEAKRIYYGNDGLQNGVNLTLMTGLVKGNLNLGESKKYTSGGKDYLVKLDSASYLGTYPNAVEEVEFTINGKKTGKLKIGDIYTLPDKTKFGVGTVIIQDYQGGVKVADFYLGAKEVVLGDADVTTKNTYYPEYLGIGDGLVVDGEEIDGVSVNIIGKDDNKKFTINAIEVNMTADDDFFVAAGKGLKDAIKAQDEDERALFTENWDFKYTCLSEEKIHELKLVADGNSQYNLEWWDGSDNKVKLPLAHVNKTKLLDFGTEDNNLVLREKREILVKDYFVVTGGSAEKGTAKSYALQYMGADATHLKNPKIRFKDLGSGTILEYATQKIDNVDSAAEIKLGGYTFLVRPYYDGGSGDYGILIDADGDGKESFKDVSIIDSYGGMFSVIPTSSSIVLSLMTPNPDDYDNVMPMNVTVEIFAKPNAQEIRAKYFGMALIVPDESIMNPEELNGWTSLGSKIIFKEPKDKPDELIVEYPEKQRLPQLYVVSGATVTK